MVCTKINLGWKGLRDYIKTTCFGHLWPSSGFMSIKISLYKLHELRYDVEISPSNYCRNLSICTGGYYARLICSVTPVVQGSHPGVCGVSSWGV
jgi:hypothetical protein